MKKTLLILVFLCGCVSAQQIQEQAATDARAMCAPLLDHSETDYYKCIMNETRNLHAAYTNQEMVRRQALAGAMQQQSLYHQQQALIRQQAANNAAANVYRAPQPRNTQCQVRGQFIDCHSY